MILNTGQKNILSYTQKWMIKNSNKYRKYKTFIKNTTLLPQKRKQTYFLLCLLGGKKEKKKAFYLQTFLLFDTMGDL